MLFAVNCTRNFEYNSWINFLIWYQLQNAIHISTQENLTIFNHFYSLHVLHQSNKYNHVKLPQSNFMFSCVVSNLCPIESVLTAYWKNAKLAKLTRLKSVCPSLIFHCNFSIGKRIENIFSFALYGKMRVGIKGQILFEIQILQYLP